MLSDGRHKRDMAAIEAKKGPFDITDAIAPNDLLGAITRR
jgi:hypothetical protein